VRFYTDDQITINEQVIDKKVAQLLNEGKTRQAQLWDSYRNFTFRVKYIDTNNLVVIQDVHGNEIHISGRGLDLV